MGARSDTMKERSRVPRRPQNPELLKRFGARLRATRLAAGVSQTRLAEVVDMRPKTISLFESGELAPTLSTVADLARALHVAIEDLVREGTVADAAPERAEEVELLGAFRDVTAEQQHAVLVLLRGLRSPG